MLRTSAARVEQGYATPSAHGVNDGRSLTAQTYGAGFNLDIDTAESAGLLNNIRIGLVWDAVDSGDTAPGPASGGDPVPSPQKRQCTIAGETIKVRPASGNIEVAATCLADWTVTSSNARYSAMVARTLSAQAYWQAALRIRRVQDSNITIDPSIRTAFGLTTVSVPNVDLVIIMTARPSPNIPIAGYANCQQRDQWNRCTVGWFNWCPELLNVVSKDDPEVISSEMHTALHEIVHVLGGMNPVIDPSSPTQSMFLSAGQILDPRGNVYINETDPVYAGRIVTRIKTPKVLNLTRIAYGCDSATGLALEDVDLGKGSHWEARVTGPELMSYGSGSGQVYVSDLTFAYLEDSNQYKCNASMGGKLSPDTIDDWTGQNLGVADSSTVYVPPPALSRGFPTYGRGQGCSFLTGLPSAVWPARYTCAKSQEYTCTADGRMSAVCIVSSTYTTEPSCASNFVSALSGSTDCGLANVACTGPSCSISPPFRYFTSDSAAQAASGLLSATAATTGGFSAAMDYVPVPVGYWSCNTPTASLNVSSGEASSGLQNFASLFGVSTDMKVLGGQARCPTCRCMQSSLVGVTNGIVGSGVSYGLCYRTNCYRPDYLQVAIKGQFGSTTAYWYKCPVEGGKVYVVGFTGSIVCPPAREFCAQEAVTGVKYPESNFVYEAIFWGILVGISLVLFFACSCPCIRDRFIGCCKRYCGALQFETDYEEDLDPSGRVLSLRAVPSRSDFAAPPKADVSANRLPGSCASWTLFSINTFTLLAGLTMFGLVVYAIYAARIFSIGIPCLGIAILVTFVSFVGWWASRKRAERGPSCWLLTYFFVDALIVILLTWTIAYNLGYAAWKTTLENNWEALSEYLPASYTAGATRAAQISNAEELIQKQLAALAGIAIAVVLTFVAALVAAGRLVHGSTLAAMTLAICNYIMLFAGVLLTVVGFYLLAREGRAANTISVIATVIVSGLYSLLVGAMGIGALFSKRLSVIAVYGVLVVLLLAFSCFCIWLFFTQSTRVLGYIDGLSDADCAAISGDLGLSFSKAQIAAALRDSLAQLGISASVFTAAALALLVSTIVYYRLVAAHAHGAAAAKAPSGDAEPGSQHRAVVHINDAQAGSAASYATGYATSNLRQPTQQTFGAGVPLYTIGGGPSVAALQPYNAMNTNKVRPGATIAADL